MAPRNVKEDAYSTGGKKVREKQNYLADPTVESQGSGGKK